MLGVWAMTTRPTLPADYQLAELGKRLTGST